MSLWRVFAALPLGIATAVAKKIAMSQYDCRTSGGAVQQFFPISAVKRRYWKVTSGRDALQWVPHWR